MSTVHPQDALRSFLSVPFKPRTYRALVYNLLALPLGLAYIVVLVTGLAVGLGMSVTFAGPVVLLATLLFIVTMACADGQFTGVLLGADIAPAFPDTDDLRAFLKQLVVGRLTWAGAAYLLVRFALGVVALVALSVGFTVAGSLMVAPFSYGEYTIIHYGVGAIAIDTVGRAFVAAAGGVLVGLLTLHLSNLLGSANATAARELLDPDEAAADAE